MYPLLDILAARGRQPMTIRLHSKFSRFLRLNRWVWVGIALGLIILFSSLFGWSSQPAQSAPDRFTPVQVAQTANSVEDLQKRQQQIEQERSRVQQERDRLQNLEQSAQNRLSGLKDTIQATSTQIKDNEYQLQLASQRLKELQQDLLKAEQSYDAKQRSTVARLQFLQRQQGPQGWAVLLESQNLNEFLDRRRQLKLVYAADRTMLGNLKQQAEQIKQQRSDVERQKNEIALLTEQLQAQKQDYEAQAQTQDQLVSRLKQDRQALEAAEAQLVRDSQDLGNLIRRKLAEQEAARRRAAQQGQIVIRGTGQFTYPTNAPITSSFGTRIHPILGYRRFHAGVDFGATHGSTIRSADSGTVIFSGWYGGYGRSVIVDHGGGLTSLYAHASELYVNEGEPVKRGQAIAAVGSTGLSTGPHLHFEVRKNGDPVNPMNYL